MKHLILGLNYATNSIDLMEFVVVTIFSIVSILLLVLLTLFGFQLINGGIEIFF